MAHTNQGHPKFLLNLHTALTEEQDFIDQLAAALSVTLPEPTYNAHSKLADQTAWVRSEYRLACLALIDTAVAALLAP